jgi:sulfate/thiosulfate transport system ATP-binding protein
MRIGDGNAGFELASPEHASAQNAKAFAYVRPHDLDVQRYTTGTAQDGIAATLVRAIVVGPVARLELAPQDREAAGGNDIIEAHLGAQEWQALGLKEGDVTMLTPRKARVFVA